MQYNSFIEYLDKHPDSDYERYLSDRFNSETKSQREESGFLHAINVIAKELNFSDDELADRFNVGLSTFQDWKTKPLPYSHIQKKIVLFLNCARIEILICNQCDKKKIPMEMVGLTCKKCLGKE